MTCKKTAKISFFDCQSMAKCQSMLSFVGYIIKITKKPPFEFRTEIFNFSVDFIYNVTTSTLSTCRCANDSCPNAL